MVRKVGVTYMGKVSHIAIEKMIKGETFNKCTVYVDLIADQYPVEFIII